MPRPALAGLHPSAVIGACIAAANARELDSWSTLVEPTATLVAALDGVNTQTSDLATQARVLLEATSALTLEAGWLAAVDPGTAVVELTVDAVTNDATLHIEGIAAKVELADDGRIRSVSLFLLDPSFGGAITPLAAGAAT
jgi:hypothetical protein